MSKAKRGAPAPFPVRATVDPELLDGRDLILSWASRAPHQHMTGAICPECLGDMLRVGLMELAQTYEVCSCGLVSYPHLVEQLWHRRCLARRIVNLLGHGG